MTKDEAKQKVAELVAKYESLNQTQIKGFNEAMTKLGFIDPLFRALGWNFEDSNEVTPEEKASNGRVDYAFKLNGVSQFYLEAKSLKADLTNPQYVKQAVTYAYNKGVTWAILTDFRELRVFNAQSGKGWLTLTCGDYVSSFEKVWLLSRESLSGGLLNKEAAQQGALPPPLPIEMRLYRQLRQWREELFNQLHGHDKDLTSNQIDEVVQRILDRLIFIRTCEDRNLEEKQLLASAHQWKSAGYKGELVEKLQHIFHYYRNIYDSELFDEHLSDSAYIEGPIVEGILTGLYDIPGSLASYDFHDIDADVLGMVYEQYLGYVATRVKEKLQAQLKLGITDEEIYEIVSKKKYRKEQGIYYTPSFVTDFIAKHTVGRFIEEHSYNETRTVKILDPACGSGSFLIRAYDELLSYHAKERGESLDELDQQDRLPVLLSNIYGVDLDMQAVEITRLNLLLRTLTKKGKLPYLSNNIRPGNSLISGGEEELKPYFGDKWQDNKPFNWEQEFQEIMANGGFDVVIGNPPYVRIQTLPRDEADYYRRAYDSAFGSFDIYVLFLERGIDLLKTGGRLGFITSGKFLKSVYGKEIQQIIRTKCTVENIIDLSAQHVFGEATTYPVIIVLRKHKSQDKLHYVLVPPESNLTKGQEFVQMGGMETDQDAITDGAWPPISDDNPVMTRLQQQTVRLSEVTDRIFQGLKTSADEVFVLRLVREQDHEIVAFSDSLNKQVHLEPQLVRPLIKTGQMERYLIKQPDKIILFPYFDGELSPVEDLQVQYPLTWKYLLQNKKQLSARERGAFAGEKWYQYGRNQAIQTISLPKIVTPDFAPSARFSLDKDGVYFFSGGTAGGYGVIPSKNTHALFLLGLLNSRLLDWYLRGISSNFQGGYFSYESRYIKKLPIRQIDFHNPTDKKMHDALIALVERMLQLRQQMVAVGGILTSELVHIEHEIMRTDKEIDNLVYDLYGLTEEERQLVGEGA